MFLTVVAGACADSSDDPFDFDRDAAGGTAGAVAVARNALTIDDASVAPIAAYSTALKLRVAYAGAAFRVRRASDNTELDVGFTGNRVNASALVSFCGSTDCFLVTLYDQSGSAQDLAQNTVANEIKMYDGTARALVGGNSYPLISVTSPGKCVVRGGTLGLSGNPAFTIAYAGRYFAGTNRNEITPINICGVASPVNSSIGVGFGEPVAGPWLLTGGGNIGWANTGSESQTHRGVLRHAAGASMGASTFRFNGVDLGASNIGSNGSLPFDITPSFTLIGKSPSNNNDSGSELSSVLVWNTVLGDHDLAVVEQLLDPALAWCGNGVVDSNEECDDGNLADGDACSSTCTLPPANPNAALLDTVTAPVGAYSVALKLRAAYTGAAFRVRRAGDNTQQDIGFVTGNKVNGAAVQTFCTSNDCFVTTLYDQSGSGRNLVQNTTANQYRIYVGATQTVMQTDGQPVLTTEGIARWLVSNTTSNGLTSAGAMTMAYRGRVGAAPAVLAQTYHLDGWVTGLVFQAGTPVQMVTSYDSGAVGALAGAVTSTHTGVLYKDASATVGSTVMRVNGAQLALNQTSNPTTVPRLGDQTLVLGNDGTRGANGTTEISTFLLWDRVLTTREVTIVEGGLGGSSPSQCASGAACSEQCPCEAGKICSNNLGCRRDLTCRTDVAASFGYPAGTGVCWDPACDDPTSPRFSCGSPAALCGACPGGCAADCGGLSCGSDGCYGDCGVACQIGGLGCDDHTDCATGSCAIDSDGENICVDDICEHPGTNPCSDPANGGLTTTCGTCPVCTPDCTGRSCGSAPNGCGSCDTSTLDPATQYCSEQGHIVFRAVFPPSSENIADGATVAGNLPGDFQVNAFGQATYTLPLPVPPGRNDLQPDLALVYNNEAGNGYVGMGWSLSGLSSIERCGKTIAQDGAVAPITYTKSDRYCLDGKRLVLENASATYGANGTAYHTELDDLTRVVSFEPSNAAEPHHFEVRTHDGRILTYDFRVPGSRPLTEGVWDPNFEHDPNASVRSQSWLLTQVQDRFGNTMHIRYAVPAWLAEGGPLVGGINQAVSSAQSFVSAFGGPVREYYPVRIDYSSNLDGSGNTRVESDRYIELRYRTRRDTLAGYRRGARYERTKLLDRITAYAQGGMIYRYDLAYDEPTLDASGKVPHTQLQARSRLRTVTQCARASTERTGTAAGVACKPPTTFEYENVDGGLLPFTNTSFNLPFRSDEDAEFLGAPITLDLNGNGRDDLMFTSCTSSLTEPCTSMQWNVILDGVPLAASAYGHRERTASRPNVITPIVPAEVFVFDYDLDGRDDVIEVDAAYHSAFGGRLRKWSFANGKLDFQDVGPVIANPSSNWALAPADGTVSFLDANGDGAPDLLTCTETHSDSWSQTRSVTKIVNSRWQLYLRNPQTGSYSAATDVTLTEGPADVALACQGGIAVDVEGDGKQELLLNVVNSREWSLYRGGSRLEPNSQASSILWPLTGKVVRSAIPATKEGRVRLALDVNGDSLTDVIELTDNFQLYTWINTGAGFVSRKQGLSLAGIHEAYNGSQFQKMFARYAQVYDENADGRQDLLIRVSDSECEVLRSLGNSFVVTLLSMPSPMIGDPFYVFDINADGLRDLIVTGNSSNTSTKTMLARGSGAPRLIVVTDGLGARTAITYAPAARDGGGVYTRDDTACAYPVFCPGRPQGAVVSSYALWDRPFGAGGLPTRSLTYKYAGYAVDVLGRGTLGFTTETISDDARKEGSNAHKLTLRYNNKFRDALTGLYPLVGRIASRSDESYTHTSSRLHVEAIANTWVLSENDFIRPTSRSIFVAPFSSVASVVEADTAGTNGKILSQVTNSWQYDSFGNPTLARAQWSNGTFTETDSEYVLDTEHTSRWLISLPRQRVTTGGPTPSRQRTEQYVYPEDAGGSGVLAYTGVPESVIVEPNVAPRTLTTRYTYNAYGNVTQQSTTGATIDGARTRTVNVTYDSAQMFPSSISVNPGSGAHTTTVGYDQGLGIPVMTTGAGRTGETVTARTIPDGFGRPRAVIEPNDAKTFFTYSIPSGGGIAVRTQRAGAPSETITYDVLGRPIRRDFDGWNAAMVQLTQYNAQGLPSLVSRSYSGSPTDRHDTTITYDAQGRQLIATWPNTRTVENCYLDNVSCTRNPRGYTSCEVRDIRGQTLYSVLPQENTNPCATVASQVATAFPFDGSAPPASSYRASKSQYDAFGALIRLEDPAHNAITFALDSYGRVQQKVDPDSGTWQHTYNAFGETETEVDPDNLTAVFRYDNLGRTVSRTDVGTATQITQLTSWTFDSSYFGLLAATSSPDGSTASYTYTHGGELDTLTRTIPSAPFNGASQPAQTMTRRNEYDTSHRLYRVSYGSAVNATPLALQYRYNTRGYLDRVSKLVSGSTTLDYWTALGVDLYGLLTSERYGNNLTGTRTYLPDTGLLDVLRTTRSTTDVENWKHLYDENNQLRIRRNQLSGAGSETRYLYDASDRLLSATLFPSSTSTTARYAEVYTYDPAGTGNILSKALSGTSVSSPRTWTYGYGSRPHAISSLSAGTTTQTYGYDASGELSARSAGASTMPSALALDYNRSHMPKHLGTAPGASGGVDLQYDAFKERVHKVVAGAPATETFYIDDAFSRVHTVGTSGYTEHLVVDAGNRSVAEVLRASSGSETVAYLHPDAYGSVELVTNSSGTVAEQREFEAFGKRRQVTGTPLFTTRGDFTGHELDNDLSFGLINAKARLYDPAIGRFLAPDPIIGNPWNSQDLNPYSYVRNRPTVFTDPTGMQSDDGGGGTTVGPPPPPPPPGGDGRQGGRGVLKFLRKIADAFGFDGGYAQPSRGIAAAFEVSESATALVNHNIENVLTSAVDLVKGVADGYSPLTPLLNATSVFGNDDLYNVGMVVGGSIGFVQDAALIGTGLAESIPTAAFAVATGGLGAGALAIPAAQIAGGAAMAPKHVANIERGINYAKSKGGSGGAEAPKGSRNPKVAAAAKRGREAHTNYKDAVGGRADTEVRLPSGKVADAVEWENRVVRELKPDNARAIQRGERQVEGYRKELQEAYPDGEPWQGVVDTYKP